jgi:heptosyltransferase-3
MNPVIIPADLLRNTTKVLFITHLALGDFTYLNNFFKAFANAYPHLRIDIWVDELRRTNDRTQWPYLQKYALYDWLEQCDYIGKLYKETYSPAGYQSSIKDAQAENYPLIISLATLRPHHYASLARTISNTAYIIGIKKRMHCFQLHHYLDYRKLDAVIRPYHHPWKQQHHITDVYADMFHQIGDLTLTPEERLPMLHIPQQFREQARTLINTWQASTSNKIVFINPYAKINKRSWPLAQVFELIRAMQSLPDWRDTLFIVNTPPNALETTRLMLDQSNLARTHLFSADHHFFELPAMLAESHLIISVETAVMHLANAVHIPVIALMRKKSPEWAPIDKANSTIVLTTRRRDWIKHISPTRVLQVITSS